MTHNPHRPQSPSRDVPGGPPLPRSGAAQRSSGSRPPGRRSDGQRSGGQGSDGQRAQRPAGPVSGGRHSDPVGRPGGTRPGSTGPARPGRSASDAGETHVLGAGRLIADTAAVEPAKKPDLTFSKIAAAAGAAATSAVAGSYLGAAGTVAGAALGSVVTTIATTMYQRSLDKTRETVLQRVKLPGKDGAADTTVLAEPVDPLATIPLQRDGEIVAPVLPAEDRRRWFTRKRVWVTAATTVIAFAIGLLVITGVEWAKGSPISGGDSGTSVGRVVTGGSAPAEESTTDESTTPSTSEQAPSESTQETGDTSATRSATPSTSTSPTTSQAPSTGTTGTGGAADQQRSGGGTEPTG